MIRSLGYSEDQINQFVKDRGYDVLGEIMIATVDTNWNRLLASLGKIKKSSYKASEKYIVHHQDTEYFIGNVAFTVENFNRVIRALNIDPCRFVIFTNHYGSTAKWLEYCNHEKNQFVVVESPWTNYVRCEQPTTPITTTNCNYHFSCIMGRARAHRDKLSHWLLENQLDRSNLVVYNRSDDAPMPEETFSQTTDSIGIDHFSYLSPIPFTRINEEWTNYSKLKSSLTPIKNYEILPYQFNDKFSSPWYESVLFDLITETVFNYPYAYISEKTIRPIAVGRPFVLVSAPHTLDWLRNMGFKTFDRWWDESYDQCQDPDSRLQKVFATIEHICSIPLEQCQQMLEEMAPVLLHNQKRYEELAF